MRVTLTRDLGVHQAGTTQDVTTALAARLVRKGAARQADTPKVKKASDDHGEEN